jgi:hypothetical protein
MADYDAKRAAYRASHAFHKIRHDAYITNPVIKARLAVYRPAYYHANKDRILAQSRSKYRIPSNKAHYAVKHLEYYVKNKRKILARTHKYQKTTKGKALVAIRRAKFYSTVEGKLRVKARAAVGAAVLSRKLLKLPCRVCGNPKVEAHHWKGYGAKHIYDVVWLCRKCHMLEHKKQKRPRRV